MAMKKKKKRHANYKGRDALSVKLWLTTHEYIRYRMKEFMKEHNTTISLIDAVDRLLKQGGKIKPTELDKDPNRPKINRFI